MSFIALPANDIDIAGRALELDLPSSWLTSELADAEVTAQAPGHLKARLSRSGIADIVVRGRVKATVSVPCARCLGPAPVPVDAELSLLLRPAPVPRADARVAGANGQQASAARKPAKPAKDKDPEYEFTAEEADTDTYDGETVVLDGFVREAILLELPSFPLCSEACPGIGPAAPGVVAEAEPAPAPDETAEERPASLDDLRDRFAQRSGRIPRAPEPTLKNDTPSKKTKKE